MDAPIFDKLASEGFPGDALCVPAEKFKELEIIARTLKERLGEADYLYRSDIEAIKAFEQFERENLE